MALTRHRLSRFKLTLQRHMRLAYCVVVLAFAANLAALAATDLVSALEQAQHSDPAYREAQANALAVAEGIPQARAHLWKPVLEFTTGGSRVVQDISLDGGFGADGEVSYYTTDYSLSLLQPVYHYDRFVRLKQADRRLQQAQYELDASLQDLIVRVAERYFEVLAATDNLAFAQAEKKSLAGQLEQARQRFDVGLTAITDVQEAQAGYDRAVASEILAENLLANAHEALRETTGVYFDDLLSLGETLPLKLPQPGDIEAWTEGALAQNLQLAAALTAAEIAEQEIKAQFAGHHPSIDIQGAHGFNSQGGRFGNTDATTSNVGIRLNVPLYEGGAVASRTRQAEHEHQAALERVVQVRRAVQRGAREAYLGIIARISTVKALRQAVISSRTAVDSTRAGFDVGTRTAVDVVTAERGLFQARRDYARARYDYVLDLLRLKHATGTLAPEDLTIANGWLESESHAKSVQ